MTTLPRLALSIRQPWAHFVAHGWKPVENRSWRRDNPGVRFRGAFAIHASTGMTRDEYDAAAELAKVLGYECPRPADLLRGGIVGVAKVVDVVKDHDSPWFFGPRALVIAEARTVDFIPVGGRLGFFEWRPLLPYCKTDGPVAPARWMTGAPKVQAVECLETQGRLI